MKEWFSSLKIRTKLLAAFLVIVAISVAAMGYGIYSMGQMVASSQETAREVQELATYNDLERLTFEQELAERNFILTGDTSNLDSINESFVAVSQQIDHALTVVENEEEAAEIRELKQAIQEDNASWAEVVDLYQSGQTEQASALVVGEDDQEEGAYELLSERSADARADMAVHIQASADQANRAFLIGMGASIVAILAAVGLAFFLAQRITTPIIQLKAVAEKVSMGNLDDLSTRLPATSRDEIGDLADAFGRMVTAVRFFAADSNKEI